MSAPGPCRRLDGDTVVQALRERHQADRRALYERGIRPRLALVRAGDHPAATAYADAVARLGKTWPADVMLDVLPPNASAAALRRHVRARGKEADVHGVFLAGPLPSELVAADVEAALPLARDVAAAHPTAQARFLEGHAVFEPIPVVALDALLAVACGERDGRRAVVVARPGTIPLLIATALHRRGSAVELITPEQAAGEATRRADLLVLLDGEREAVTGDDVMPGAVVLDFGVHVAEDGELVGHADHASIEPHAGALTPVPGGVGPVMAAALLSNLTKAARGGDPPAGRETLPLFGGRG